MVDPVTGEVKIVKKKSIKRSDGEKKVSVKSKEKQEDRPSTLDKDQPDSGAAAESPKKKKNLVTNEVTLPSVDSKAPESASKKKSIATTETVMSLLPSIVPETPKKKSVISQDSTQETPKKKSIISQDSTQETPKKTNLVSTDSTFETPKKQNSVTSDSKESVQETPKKKKSVVLVETLLTQPVEPKPSSFLDILKKRKSLPAELPVISQEQKKDVLVVKKKSLVTEELPPIRPKPEDKAEKMTIISTEATKRKSIVKVEPPSDPPKALDSKGKQSNGDTPKKKKILTSGSSTEVSLSDPAKSIDSLTLPRVEKKAQKSESSDSTKENRDNSEKKPTRQVCKCNFEIDMVLGCGKEERKD